MRIIARATWKQQMLGHEELFLKLSEHLPKELISERELLVCRSAACEWEGVT